VTQAGEVSLAPPRERASIVAGLAVGACLTWNVTNVGAVADPLAETYGTSLAVIGLLTTALFVAHLAAQLPAGIGADRYGARSVALAAIALAVVGNAVALIAPSVAVAAAGRTIVGLGSGAGFVAGLDLVRVGGGGAVSQGIYGGATMAGGGLALMTLPAITDAMSWRAPFWTAIVLALAAAVPTLAAPSARHAVLGSGSLGRVSDLLPLGAVQAGSFGLSVVAGNWVVTLLEREGAGSTLAGLAGGLTLLAGIVTRPWGGVVVRRRRALSRAAVAASLVAGAVGTALLAAGVSLGLSAVAALLLGLAAGFPFAAVFDATVRLRPGAPAAAIGLVNGCAVLTILVGTPLAGLTFSLPGDGRIGFAVIAALWGATLLALPRTPIGRPLGRP
jgi:MFS family permease